MTTSRTLCLAPAAALLAAALTACGGGPAEEAAQPVGNATPAPSPAAEDPAGDVVDLPEAVGGALDLVAAGESIAVLGESGLAVGTPDEFRSGEPEVYETGEGCGQLSARGATVAVACGETALILDAGSGEEPRRVELDAAHPATSAVVTGDGRLVTANDSDNEVAVYRDAKGGSPADVIEVEAPTDRLVAVANHDGPDGVVRVWREDSTIQNVDLEGSREGGRLRVGLGVGEASPGGSGVIVASDTTGDQVAIYTSAGVVRLQQTSPVAESPWGVAFDSSRGLALVASTKENVLQGYSVATGVPELEAEAPTIANVRSVAATESGEIALVADAGGQLQLIDEL
ncbi:hypothetical protein [Corynebacterium otitidis]|uniref:hypothetical protein n=1 Tax=Corynebacterium otitidis TaxID=29321 RepID=UPI0006281595|nr:hypothetical protein [Corynebacterium otitidis]KKO84578.1 hypothetical protein AAV33_00250 [Corynebacterium otitidis]